MKLLTVFIIFAASIIQARAVIKKSDPTLACNNRAIEICILLDSSLSVGRENYYTAIRFLQNFISHFDINPGPDGVRVCVIPYARGVYNAVGFKLNAYNTTTQVTQAIGNITYTGEARTDTNLAIEHMYSVEMTNNTVRPGVRKVGIVLTDGRSQKTQETARVAANARQDGIVMFAIGVGNETFDVELHNIAGDSGLIFKVGNYSQLFTIIDTLANQTCLAASPKLSCGSGGLELSIALDSSRSIRPEDYNASLQFLKDFIRQFEISTDPNGVRVSIIPYRRETYGEFGFNLTTHNSTDKVVEAIGNISFQSGGLTDTGVAISYIHHHQLGNRVARSGTRKVCIVLTAGPSLMPRLAKAASEAAQAEGITMYVIGVGPDVNPTELYDIAGSASGVITVSGYDQLNSIIDNLANQTCHACRVAGPAEIMFLFSPSDLTEFHTTLAVQFINLTINSTRMQSGYRYGVMTSVCDDDDGLNISPCGNMAYVQQQLSLYQGVQLKRLAKKLANTGFGLISGPYNHTRKIAVLVSKSATVSALTDEVQALAAKGIQVFIAILGIHEVIVPGAVTLADTRTTVGIDSLPRILSEKLVEALHPQVNS